jgi:hypothetical protein
LLGHIEPLYPEVYAANSNINSYQLCTIIENQTNEIASCNRVHNSVLSMGLKTAISAIEMQVRNIEYFILSNPDMHNDDFREIIKLFDFSSMIDIKAKYLNFGYDNVTHEFINQSDIFLGSQMLFSKIRFTLLVVLVFVLLVVVLGVYMSSINNYMMSIRQIISIIPTNVLLMRLNEFVDALKKLS